MNGEIKIFDILSKQFLPSFDVGEPLTSIAVTPNGSKLYMGTGTGGVFPVEIPSNTIKNFITPDFQAFNVTGVAIT